MKTRAFPYVAATLLSSTMIVPAVSAQDAGDQLMSIYEKQRPDYSAAGVRTGSFLFYPTVELEGKFDSNIFATDKDVSDDVDDFIAIIKPSFALTSDWNNNYLSLFADADIAKYADNGQEDYEDFNIGTSGRLDITRGSSVSLDASYKEGHEDRGAVDDTGTQQQTTYSLFDAAIGFKRDEGLVSFAIDGSYADQDFSNGTSVADAARADIRDRETLTGAVRLGYHVNDEYEAFVKFTGVKVTYDDSTATGGRRRDSDGWDVVGGTAFKLSGTAEGEVYVGYVKRDFDSASFGDVSDVKFGASVLWAPTGLTTARIAVDRNVVETTVAAENSVGTTVPSGGILSTLYSLRVEHELQRNLLINANASFNKMDFVNTVRNDDLTNLGLGAKYLMNRNIALNADYGFAKRSTNAADQNYDRHTFMVSLSAQW